MKKGAKQNLNRQYLPPGLWVVATPIGNLQDLSPRATEVLFQADKILCEDTRRAATLLGALCQKGEEAGQLVNREYMKRLFRLDAHTSDAVHLSKWMDALRAGEALALITDAGTPAVSDPGAELVAECRRQGVAVTPVPGPSAVTAFLSACGLTGTCFSFRGFFPREKKDREREVQRVLAQGDGCIEIWFDAPPRLVSSLEYWRSAAGAEVTAVQCSAAKELTKIHEKFFFGTLAEVETAVREEIAKEGERGEWCFAVQYTRVHRDGAQKSASQQREGDREGGEESQGGWKMTLRSLLACGVSVSDAVAEVKGSYQLQKRVVYEEALRLKPQKIK